MVSTRASGRRFSLRRAVMAALVAGVSIAGTISAIGAPSSALDVLGVTTSTDASSTTTTTVASDSTTTLPPDSSTTTTTLPPTTTTTWGVGGSPTAVPGAAPSGPAGPAVGALFGAHAKTGSSEAAQKSGVSDLETKLGRKLAIDHYYRPWETPFPTTREQWDFANGRIPMISWAKTYTDQIAFGFEDDFIRQRADAIAALGQPLLIRWFWEMDGKRNQQYTESPALYTAAWQRIVTIFRQEGATNVGWVWCPDADAFDDASAQAYYPGDDYVDWVCADGYNWYLKAGDHDTSFKNVFKNFYAWAMTTGKPIMVGEYGVLEASAQGKANWVNAARTTLKTDQTGIDAVVYFNSYGYDDHDIWRDWTMDSSPDSLNAFALMGADPYFNGSPPVPTPDTLLAATSGPTGTVKTKTASFTFSVAPADPSATFGCRIDGAAFAACTSPFTTAALGDGAHTFEVRANNAGGTDPTAAKRAWSIDTTGPTLSGLTPAAGATGVARDAAASAVFNEAVDTTTVSGTTVKVTGPGGAALAATVGYSAATRTVTVTPSARLAFNTTYTVTVKGGSTGVADVLGNRMAADKAWSFTTIPPPPVPNTFLGSGPADPSAAATATFTFSSDQPGAAFQCQLDGAAFSDCLSPLTLTGLADGSHNFAVRAWTIDGGTDADPAVRSWLVDTTPPGVSGTSPASGAAGVGLGSVVTATFSEAVDPTTVNASTVSLRSDTAAVTATVAYDAASRTVTLTPGAPLLAGTPYTMSVKGGSTGVADVAGNRMAADRGWGFSTWAPVPGTTLDPATGPTGTVTTSAASFAFSSDQAGAGFTCRLDGGTAAACTSPWSPSGPLADGQHTVQVAAWTMYGGADPDPATRTWIVDTTAPAVSAVTPADNSVAAASSVRATFTEPVAPATVTSSTFSLVAGTGTPVPATVAWDPATTSAVLTPAAPLVAGAALTVTVKGGAGGVTDVAGNALATDKVWHFTVPVAAPKTTTFRAVADARVEKATPTKNFGKDSKLKTDPGTASYLRFTVSGLSGTVQSAKLRLYVVNKTVDGPAVYRTSSSWTESGKSGITWKSAPGPGGAALDDKGKVAASVWVEYDVTAAVAGNGTVSFVLSGPGSDLFAAYSKEQGSSKAPQLVMTTG